ncbi:hypothetical protein CEXT_272611 [Caerostris extrusa]|uniref:Uncharacterized protein n=1 Tax=Caerostris extrusa TaxID=172846 RepID=A0AAV4ST38_CAEEX|nr:hypothetical protein CEXT_272611 [Caerostris extrusa]
MPPVRQPQKPTCTPYIPPHHIINEYPINQSVTWLIEIIHHAGEDPPSSSSSFPILIHRLAYESDISSHWRKCLMVTDVLETIRMNSMLLWLIESTVPNLGLLFSKLSTKRLERDFLMSPPIYYFCSASTTIF